MLSPTSRKRDKALTVLVFCRESKIPRKKTENHEKSCRFQSESPLNSIQRCKAPKIFKRCKNCNRLHCFVRVCKGRQSLHSMDKEDASSIISSNVFFKARTDKIAMENDKAINQKVIFLNAKLNKVPRVQLYHPVHGGVAGSGVLLFCCLQRYWLCRAVLLEGNHSSFPTAVNLWIHKLSPKCY